MWELMTATIIFYGLSKFCLRSGSFVHFLCFYGQLWVLISGWFGISTTLQGSLFEHFLHFEGLGDFSYKSRNKRKFAPNAIYTFHDWWFSY
ncbi:hypothetical protein MtrunA17_Chr3g0109271 [Medicago truncatula]|uniref:Transmembrane protein n=1 Tax=Medicago truncatula TaxID=3880 RepID=A0A396IYJ2_MEDTR|nr:hypothetical protein MtrunA17_Chr3g0109271 [Medicago truncatula]